MVRGHRRRLGEMKAAGGPMAPAMKRLPPAATWIGEGEAAVGGLGKTEKVTER